ncbi:uncharacterized protein LOC142981650 [Anticarsia gemmatalis]|uniref:uncharacterized protein LOC142981650 n=1 Tax=Anticarsia gemmatalis TaxID=129554 RepID=UPI003F75E1DA
MAPLYLILALVIQGSFTYANVDSCEETVENQEITNSTTEADDEVVHNFQSARRDWIDFLLLPDAHLFPTSSVAMMTHAIDTEKSAEEQLEEIKEIAQKITLAIQSEMANLLSYALSTCENKEEEGGEDNNLRKKRSIDTPMASTQLITRLLKHIKSNNEYQNIAIDKMMTAQEIADKYGVEFSPDTEIISDLAFAANQHAKDMTNLLHETLELKNLTGRVPEDNTCPAYTQPEQQQKPCAPVSEPAVNYHHYSDSYPSYNYYYNYPYETQIPPPATSNYYSPPVSKRPNFYDAVSYSPDYYPPYCSMEPVTTTTTVVLPFEEPVEPEPELVGEEFEETISSKVYVERGDEPGSATVNHVMTYTVGEKSHFKTPEIERLPQQMQYCFFLM